MSLDNHFDPTGPPRSDEEAAARRDRAAELIRGIDTVAPGRLHGTVTQMAASRRKLASGARRHLVGVSALVSAVAAAVVLLLVGAGSAAPTIAQVAAVSAQPATLPAPQQLGSTGALAASVGDVRFPDWRRANGWRPTGSRVDNISGRFVRTVVYGPAASSDGRRYATVSYAIVGGQQLPVSRGQTVERAGVRYTIAALDGRRVVTWVQSGHTCVLSSRTASTDTLLRLASTPAPDYAASVAGT